MAADLEGTTVTVNMLLPGGATHTGEWSRRRGRTTFATSCSNPR